MNKSAKEMFEELGYIQTANDDFCIEYKYEDVYRIEFLIKPKLIQICNDNNSYFITCDKDLIQTINKQIEELGWNNE